MSGVAEMHGVWASGKETTKGQWIEARHVGTDRIEISHTSSLAPLLTANEARYFARKLLRLANGIEGRQS